MNQGGGDPVQDRMRRLLPWLAVDVVGGICLAFGLIGATSTALHRAIPMLADKDNAWRLAGVGALLIALALPAILKILRSKGGVAGESLPPGASR